MEQGNNEEEIIQVTDSSPEQVLKDIPQTLMVNREIHVASAGFATPARVIPGRPTTVSRPLQRQFYTNQSPLVRLGNNLPAMIPRISGYKIRPSEVRSPVKESQRATDGGPRHSATTSTTPIDSLDSTISEVAKAPPAPTSVTVPVLSFAVRATGSQPGTSKATTMIRPGGAVIRTSGERRPFTMNGNGDAVRPMGEDCEQEPIIRNSLKKTTPVTMKPRMINEDQAKMAQAKLASDREKARHAASLMRERTYKSPRAPVKKTKNVTPSEKNGDSPNKKNGSLIESEQIPFVFDGVPATLNINLPKPRGTMIQDKVYEIRMPDPVTIRLSDEENQIMNRLKQKDNLRTFEEHMEDMRQFKTALSYCSRLIDYQHDIIQELHEKVLEFKKSGDEWRKEAKKLQRQMACRIIKPHITKYKTPYSKVSRKKQIRAKLKQMVHDTFEYSEDDMKKLLRETFPEAFHPNDNQDLSKEDWNKKDDDEDDDEDFIPQHVYMSGQVPHESLYY